MGHPKYTRHLAALRLGGILGANVPRTDGAIGSRELFERADQAVARARELWLETESLILEYRALVAGLRMLLDVERAERAMVARLELRQQTLEALTQARSLLASVQAGRWAGPQGAEERVSFRRSSSFTNRGQSRRGQTTAAVRRERGRTMTAHHPA